MYYLYTCIWQDLLSINSSTLSASSVYHRSIDASDMHFCYYLYQNPEGCRPLHDYKDIQVHESLEFKDKSRTRDAKAYLISINITGILTMNIKTGDNAKINCYKRVNAAILTTCKIFLASPFCRAYRDFKCKRCLYCVV